VRRRIRRARGRGTVQVELATDASRGGDLPEADHGPAITSTGRSGRGRQRRVHRRPLNACFFWAQTTRRTEGGRALPALPHEEPEGRHRGGDEGGIGDRAVASGARAGRGNAVLSPPGRPGPSTRAQHTVGEVVGRPHRGVLTARTVKASRRAEPTAKPLMHLRRG